MWEIQGGTYSPGIPQSTQRTHCKNPVVGQNKLQHRLDKRTGDGSVKTISSIPTLAIEEKAGVSSSRGQPLYDKVNSQVVP